METAKNQTAQTRLLRPDKASLVPGGKITVGPQPVEPGPNGDPTQASQPEIQINRNDQGVESIEVVCSCGERIVIRCEYA
jgi:hypothetical protein